MNEKLSKRFWEIDFLRGLAIIAMIIFHLAYDVSYFKMFNFDIHTGNWILFGKVIFISFFVLVGISLSLSHSRFIKTNSTNPPFNKYLIRGAKIFSWGLIITLFTWIFMREGFVIFGVLHFIGLSIILSYPFLKLSRLNLFFGLLIILIGLMLMSYSFSFPWLLWLGLKPNIFYTVDYFPIFPYFGIILIGIYIGKKLYADYSRRFRIKDLSKAPIVKQVDFLGKNSLIIYLLHQPILIILLQVLAIFL